jgi:membrane associated rhomboid family serine protease
MRSSLGGFGGPPTLQSTAARLALGVVVGSVVWALLANSGLDWLLLLTPAAVVERVALWQPLTYAFVATSPLAVLFSGLIIWSMGGALEQTWGGRRMVRFVLGVTVGAGLLTVLLGLLVPSLRLVSYPGATVLTSVLWVAFGLAWGRGQTGFWGIPMTGNTFALVGVGFVFLNAAFGGWRSAVPEVLGLVLTWGYLRLGSPRMLWLRLQSWRLQRQLRGSRRHLRVVKDEERRDRYLN